MRHSLPLRFLPSSFLATAALLWSVAWPGPLAAQMAIDELIITSGPAYLDGFFTDFFIDPVVFGFEIAAVSVTTQSGETVNFVEIDDDEFACDGVIPSEPCEGFESLAEINALGNLTFNLLGESGEIDVIFVPAADYTPGSGQIGMPTILSPPQGNSSIPAGGLFVWAAAPAWVEAIHVGLVDIQIDDGVDEALFFDNTIASWSPVGIVVGRDYEFELSFLDLFVVEDERTTMQDRPYVFTSGFSAFNSKFVPEPGGTAVWVAATVWLVLIGRKQPQGRRVYARQ